ncbi:MAG: hypothetical protein H0Z33_03370 [Bacillaceae bacterium]|nr:hypothetical protein [Bacillaceae bacterium]
MRKKEKLDITCPECRHTYQVTREAYRRFQEEYGADLYCPRCQFQKYYGNVHSE